ncbi:MAG: hypothetical protein ABR616_05585 [Dermatophilaceae bacterium]
MQIHTAAPLATLAAAYAALTDAIHAIETVDVSSTEDAAVRLMRDRRDVIEGELDRNGVRPCGVCKTSTPGAVDWGCSCGMTADELNAEAVRFARIHD